MLDPWEGCDDDDPIFSDPGCNDFCVIEEGYYCVGIPSVCFQI